MSLVGTQLQSFSVEAFQGFEFKKITDADLKGKWSVVFFYPADFTFVCPTELEDLADNYAEFKKIGCEIYSVSTDTHFTHKAWHDSSEAIKKVEFPDARRSDRPDDPQLRRYDRKRRSCSARYIRDQPRGPYRYLRNS